MDLIVEYWNSGYDDRNLTACRCGCGRKFASKRMFAEFLSGYRDIPGQARIWSTVSEHKATIYVELEYDIPE
jgi:hypothetical protein